MCVRTLRVLERKNRVVLDFIQQIERRSPTYLFVGPDNQGWRDRGYEELLVTVEGSTQTLIVKRARCPF